MDYTSTKSWDFKEWNAQCVYFSSCYMGGYEWSFLKGNKKTRGRYSSVRSQKKIDFHNLD